MNENWLVIVNPAARNGGNRGLIERAAGLLDVEGVRYRLVEPESLAQGLEAASGSRRRGYTRVVAVGGDGTAHHMANGAIEAGVPFGLIPAGSGNDFASAMGLNNDLEHAVHTLVHGRRESIGVVRVTTTEGVHYAINMTDAGIGARVALAARTRLKWLFGPLRYNLISLGTLLGHRNVAARVTLDDGEPRKVSLAMIICGFGQTAGAGMHFLPESRHDNDRMHGCILFDAGRLRTLQALRKVWHGGHREMTDIVSTFEASRVSVETVDDADSLWVESEGEVHGRTPATMEAVPRGLEVYVPEDFSLSEPSRLVKGA